MSDRTLGELAAAERIQLAAWMVLRRHGENVQGAARPWAHLMSSAQRQVLDEVRAQQLLTNAASIRGRAREALPRVVRPVGSTLIDLAAALRHQSREASLNSAADPRIHRQVGRHEPLPLLADGAEREGPGVVGEREPWFATFIDLLVEHGADQAVTVAAVDRLADLFTVTYVGWWEWAAPPRPGSRNWGYARTSAAPWSHCSPAPAGTGTTASRTVCSQQSAPRPNRTARSSCPTRSTAELLCSSGPSRSHVHLRPVHAHWRSRGCEPVCIEAASFVFGLSMVAWATAYAS